MAKIEFVLPDVGEGLDEGEIVTWLVAPGDTVRRDQPLVEVQTDKALVELPSPVAGEVVSLGCSAGDIVKVGQVLLVLEDGPARDSANDPANAPTVRRVSTPGVPAPAGPYVDFPDVAELRPAGIPPVSASPSVSASPPLSGAPHSSGAPARLAEPTAAGRPAAATARPKAAPAVRKLALDRGVDLTSVTGTGPGGRILASDVEAAAAPPSPATGVPDRGVGAVRNAGWERGESRLGWMEPGRHPLRGIRRATAEAMARSWSEIPHITTMDEVDATGLLSARRRLADAGIAATIGALLVAAVARGLRRYPVLNASVEPAGATGDGAVVVHPDCNIGLAVATAEGLVVPVVTRADQRSLDDLAAEVRRLTEAARNRRVEVGELRGGTFTISNYGALGGRFATPLIRPPEVGIMGFGAIRTRPFVVDGKVEARATLPWSLSADHRLVDGDVATAFAEYATGLLADPVALLAEILSSGS